MNRQLGARRSWLGLDRWLQLPRHRSQRRLQQRLRCSVVRMRVERRKRSAMRAQPQQAICRTCPRILCATRPRYVRPAAVHLGRACRLPAHKMLPLCLGRGVNLFVAAHQIKSALAKSEQDVVELILEIVEVLFVQAAEVESPGLHESCTQARRRWRWRWRRPQKMTRYVVRVSRNDPKKMQRFCLGVHCLSRERRGAATPARSRRHRCASQGQRQARSRGHRGALAPVLLGRQLGGSRAASQRALTTRLGCSACREDVPDRTSALSLCRRAQRRRHHTFVRGGARRSCSRVQLHRRDLLASQSVLSAALWLSALPAPRGRGVFACKQVVTVLGVPPRPRGGGHVGSRRRRAETTGGAGPRPPDELQVRLPAAVGVEAPGDQQGARIFGCAEFSCCRTSRSSERAAAINRRTSRSCWLSWPATVAADATSAFSASHSRAWVACND